MVDARGQWRIVNGDAAGEAQVRQAVLALITNVDVRELDAAERRLAPQVRVDYTSLWGGQALLSTPEDVVDGWRSVILGFDATWHELGQIDVLINGATATAECDVDARHWLDGLVWRVRGRYRFRLQLMDGWRVTAMALELAEETGDRRLVERATARAAAGERAM
jgi:hypothetical protein